MLKNDLHLSALSISSFTCDDLERLGFSRDVFANNRYCVASAYHGSYTGALSIPDDKLWVDLCSLLLSDPQFQGHLEEECTQRREFITGPTDTAVGPGSIPPFHMEPVPFGRHKACDIHLGIELDLSSAESCHALEMLRMASFDRVGDKGTRRIYTVTCESESDGHAVFDVLYAFIKLLPGFVGKIKLESTTRYLRHPENAEGLPIVTTRAVRDWMSAAQNVMSESLR